MYTYVTGTDAKSYKLGDMIYNPIGVLGLKDYPRSDGTIGHVLYGDIRPLYGDPITNAPTAIVNASGDTSTRKDEGFWYMEDIQVGNTNSAGTALEYIQLDQNQPVLAFLETGGTKDLTVTRTYNYVDMAIADVKVDLKQRTRSIRDDKVNSGYQYDGQDAKGNTVSVLFSTTTDGRQMMNNYYTMAVNGAQSISINIEDQNLTFTGDQVIDIFTNMMSQTNDFYTESGKQTAAIDGVDNADSDAIFKAQTAATWVYDGQTIPPRNRT